MNDFSVEYRDIPGFRGYRVGSDGSVWSCLLPGRKCESQLHEGRIWKRRLPAKDRKGYMQISLRKHTNHFVTKKVRHLVLLAFVGPRPDGMEGRHLNGIPGDNRACNLAWSTHLENILDKKKHGTGSEGEKNAQAKITWEKAAEIRRLRSQGIQVAELARRFGIHLRNIMRVLSFATWRPDGVEREKRPSGYRRNGVYP